MIFNFNYKEKTFVIHCHKPKKLFYTSARGQYREIYLMYDYHYNNYVCVICVMHKQFKVESIICKETKELLIDKLKNNLPNSIISLIKECDLC